MSKPKKKKPPVSTNGQAPITQNEAEQSQFYELIQNEYASRADLINRFMDPRRNINDECGYPESDVMDIKLYDEMYDREAIGARVVDIEPDECWQISPDVMEDDNPDTDTDFEAAWKQLGSDLRGSTHYKQEEGSPIWEVLERADKLSGIGHFGIILLGLDDGLDLREPALLKKDADSKIKEQKLLFMRTFDESLVTISSFESDVTSPRHGQPTMYSVTFNDPTENGGGHIGAPGQNTMEVHWSRVIHVADNLKSSEIFATPRMRPVWNRLLDLRKVYGAGAEGYWKGSFPGIAFTTAPNATGQVKLDHDSVRQAAERYYNTQQRTLIGEGMEINSLAPQVVAFDSQIDTILTNICIRLAIPKRIFMGSERGELASGQDSDTWRARLQKRRNRYLTPKLVVPFIDRLILLNVLPEPGEDGYRIDWPEEDNTSPQEKATLATTRTTAMASYVSGGLDVLMSPMDYLVREMGYDEEDAEEILKDTLDHINKANPDEDDVDVVGRNPKPPELQMGEGDEEEEIAGKGKKPFPTKGKKKLVGNHPAGGHDDSSHGNRPNKDWENGPYSERAPIGDSITLHGAINAHRAASAVYMEGVGFKLPDSLASDLFNFIKHNDEVDVNKFLRRFMLPDAAQRTNDEWMSYIADNLTENDEKDSVTKNTPFLSALSHSEESAATTENGFSPHVDPIVNHPTGHDEKDHGNWSKSSKSSTELSWSDDGYAKKTVKAKGGDSIEFTDHGVGYFVVRKDGKEIGTASMNTQGGYLNVIRIHKEHQRKGIGSKLYDFIEERIKKPLKPSPDKQTDAAKALWKKRNTRKSGDSK